MKKKGLFSQIFRSVIMLEWLREDRISTKLEAGRNEESQGRLGTWSTMGRQTSHGREGYGRLLSLFKDLLIFFMYMPVWDHLVCRRVPRGQEGIRSLGPGVIGGCRRPWGAGWCGSSARTVSALSSWALSPAQLLLKGRPYERWLLV